MWILFDKEIFYCLLVLAQRLRLVEVRKHFAVPLANSRFRSRPGFRVNSVDDVPLVSYFHEV